MTWRRPSAQLNRIDALRYQNKWCEVLPKSKFKGDESFVLVTDSQSISDLLVQLSADRSTQ